MKHLAILTTILLASTMSFAAEVDAGASQFKWRADKRLGDGHWGEIKLKSSKASIKDGKVQAGEFVMDLTNVTVENLEGEWAQKFLGHIKSGDFFEVEKYPTAKLVLDRQTKKGEVRGKLTIKDKTQSVTIKFEQKGKVYTGKFTFDRTKFGVIYGAGNIFKELTADKVIKNDVELTFKVVLK